MIRSFSSKIVLLLTLVFLAACSTVSVTPTAIPTAAPAAQPTATKVLTIGQIGSSPSSAIPKFQPLADYLAARLTDYGYSAGSVRIAPDFDTMVQWIKAGQIDVLFDSPYPAMILVDRSGAKPFLRRWKGGVSEYNTVIFARTDTNIRNTSDLKGKLLALEEATSTSGYMLPKAFLIDAGLKLVEKASTTESIDSEQVGYIFTNPDDDSNIVQWVVSGKTPAGAVNSQTYDKLPDDTKKLLTELGRTETVPRHLVLARGNLDAAVVDAIKAVLLKLDATAEGLDILKKFEKTAKFDEFPNGTDTALQRMRQLYELTQKP